MELFGYSSSLESSPLELKEVTISAQPDELRKISEFIVKCAEEIEQNDGWEHEHLSENDEPQLIVHNPG